LSQKIESIVVSKKTSTWNNSADVLRTEALTEVFREGGVTVQTLPGVGRVFYGQAL
jgi:hypothetical protein